jgi:hypothetical protein
MVSQASGHRRGALYPVAAPFRNPQGESQTGMIVTEVVDAADEEHARLQGVRLARQRAGVATQTGQTLAKCGIEPFDERGIDVAAALGALQAGGNRLLITLHDAAFNGQSFRGASLDHLHDLNALPGYKTKASVVLDPIHSCPLTDAEGSATGCAFTALLFLAMAHDIACANFAPRRAVGVGAELLVGVHWCSLLASWSKQVCERTSFSTSPPYSVELPRLLHPPSIRSLPRPFSRASRTTSCSSSLAVRGRPPRCCLR